MKKVVTSCSKNFSFNIKNCKFQAELNDSDISRKAASRTRNAMLLLDQIKNFSYSSINNLKRGGLSMDSLEAISPRDFIGKLEQGELKDSLIIDVRERMEWEYYHLDEAVLIPMNTIPANMDQLPRDRKLYIVCAHGVRSANVGYYLQEQGYEKDKIINVEGGMAAVAMLRGFQYD
jgi:rhodanese-related sulfurtransferase